MPIVYTGPDDIVDHLLLAYRKAVPGDVASQARSLDEAYIAAEMVALGEGVALDWAREAHLGTSDGVWVDQHASDRGLRRQANEADTTLRERLRTSPKAVTYSAILSALLSVVHSIDPGATAYLIRSLYDYGSFCDDNAYCDTDSRITDTRLRCLIALIPASINARSAVLDMMRAKVAAGTIYSVEEF